MGTSKYYEEVASVEVHWQRGLAFTKDMLMWAFANYGSIKKVTLNSSNSAIVIFNSIEECTRTVEKFRRVGRKISI